MKRQAKKILPTMKVEVKKGDKLGIPFRECQAVITSIADVQTDYGSKPVLSLRAQDDNTEFSVFVNNFSMQNLIDAFGDEDTAYIGKIVQLTKEEDETYNNEMIVIKGL